jgi:hypothetical protein
MKSETAIRCVLLVFFIVAPSIRIFLSGDVAGASVLAAVGAAGLLLTRLPDISTFELLALKVTLEKQTRQVDVTLKQLQKMAAALAQSNLTQLAMSGQKLSGISSEYKFEIRSKIIDSLKEIGIGDAEVLGAQVTWISVSARMIFDNLEEIATSLLPDVDVEQELENLPRDPEYGLPSPKAVRGWITRKSLNEAALMRLVDEYEKMLESGVMTSPQLIPSNQTIRLRDTR